MTKNFTVYSKDGCPYCEQIVKVVLNGENLGGCQESIKYMQEKDICCKV